MKETEKEQHSVATMVRRLADATAQATAVEMASERVPN